MKRCGKAAVQREGVVRAQSARARDGAGRVRAHAAQAPRRRADPKAPLRPRDAARRPEISQMDARGAEDRQQRRRGRWVGRTFFAATAAARVGLRLGDAGSMRADLGPRRATNKRPCLGPAEGVRPGCGAGLARRGRGLQAPTGTRGARKDPPGRCGIDYKGEERSVVCLGVDAGQSIGTDSWFAVRTLPVAPLRCDLGFFPNGRGNKAAANLRPSDTLKFLHDQLVKLREGGDLAVSSLSSALSRVERSSRFLSGYLQICL